MIVKILIATFLIFSINAYSKDWNYQPNEIIIIKENSILSVNYDVLEYFVNEISNHAKNYPPKFSSQEERNDVENIVSELITITNKTTNSVLDEKLIYYSALLNYMGYVLDLPNTGQKADSYFTYLIEKHPKAKYYFNYGAFLGGVPPMQDKAINILNKAIELGDKRAYYTLGFIYLTKQDLNNGIKYFKKYYEFFPENLEIKKLIENLQNEEVKFEKNIIQ